MNLCFPHTQACALKKRQDNGKKCLVFQSTIKNKTIVFQFFEGLNDLIFGLFIFTLKKVWFKINQNNNFFP